MNEFNNTPEAAFEVTVSLRGIRTATILWNDWFRHLSWGEVWTVSPSANTFQFMTSDEDMCEQAEALADDFFKMCSDNNLEVTLKEIETPVRDC